MARAEANVLNEVGLVEMIVDKEETVMIGRTCNSEIHVLGVWTEWLRGNGWRFT